MVKKKDAEEIILGITDEEYKDIEIIAEAEEDKKEEGE